MINVGIIGGTGYTGGELIRLLLQHPEVQLTTIGTSSQVGVDIAEVHRHLWGRFHLPMVAGRAENFTACDVVFLAVPHGTSSGLAKSLIAAGVKIIDLGADFRLGDYATYQAWYGSDHAWPEALADVPYGLPERYRKEIAQANLVANPGCYPTSIILGLLPLLEKGWLDLESIVADSKSGVTGAGKGLSESTHYPNMNDGLAAYKLANHRHTPEIEQELGKIAGTNLHLSFNPHLVPMNRGILSTITVRATADLDQGMLDALYQERYGAEPFVRVRDLTHLPNTKWLTGTNYCDVAPVWDPRTKRIIVVSAIDNLVKGAAGQAIQNMNLMCGLPETMGLLAAPLCP